MVENKVSKYIIVTLIIVLLGVVFYKTYQLVMGITDNIKYHNSYSVPYQNNEYVGIYYLDNNYIALTELNTFVIHIDDNIYSGTYEISENNLKLITYDKLNEFDLSIKNNKISGLNINNINKNNEFVRE